MKEINFAIVGCGRISNNHFDAIKSCSGQAKLIAVCDIDPNALDLAVQKTGAIGYSSLSELLNNKDIEVISLCTPSGMHSAQTIEIAKKNKHIITEKPMATNWIDGLKMINACNEAKVKLFVVKQNRKNDTLKLLKQAIQEERFGKIYNVAINVFWTRPQAYYDSAKWRGTWAFDGGALMNQASHYVDLLAWLIGEVDQVFAFCSTLARKIEVEDSASVSLKWKNGALGTLNVSMLTYPNNLEGSITIIGEKGTVKIGGVAVNEIQVWKFKDLKEYDQDIFNANYSTQSVYGHGHPLYYKNVIDVLHEKCLADTDGAEGLKSLELICAMYQSAKEVKPISLPFSRSIS
nr:Gfo/Idh/MocA family oxidoreductase [Fluviispira sanaruensis]